MLAGLRAYLAAYFALVGWITFYWHWALGTGIAEAVRNTSNAGWLALPFIR